MGKTFRNKKRMFRDDYEFEDYNPRQKKQKLKKAMRPRRNENKSSYDDIEDHYYDYEGGGKTGPY